MIRTPAWAVGLGALVLASTLAHGAPVNYNESTSGDIGSLLPYVSFTFDRGLNTIAGTVGEADPLNPPPVDFDSFAFVIPAGLQLTQGQLTLSDLTGNLVDSRWVLYHGLGQDMPIEAFHPTSPGSSTFTNELPLGPGVYNLSHLQMTGVGVSSYAFTFTVIPEPASLAPLGLASLALSRRRRRGCQ